VNTTKRRLGRGLDALLGRDESFLDTDPQDTANLAYIPIDQIDRNPYQPRRQFDPTEIAALADSLRQHGMLQPILVRSLHGRYQLVAGERRLRASIEAQLAEVPARILELDDQRVSELALVENLQREDLNPLEKGTAFRDYLNRFGGTQEELAGRLGLDRSTISNLIRLLDLPEDVQAKVHANQLTQGHARALLALNDPEAQRAACQRVIAESLSVRQTESLVATGEPSPPRGRPRKDSESPPAPSSDEAAADPRAPHVLELEQQLNARFGTCVLIRVKARHRGQVVIDFNTEEEFERVAGLLRG
jgi:ParB family chromosome partitioning protein